MSDINGLLACPGCGREGHVKLQTPPDDDWIVRRAYFRCFSCMTRCPDYPAWQPAHMAQSGRGLFAPLRDHWNAWVKAGAPGARTDFEEAA